MDGWVGGWVGGRMEACSLACVLGCLLARLRVYVGRREFGSCALCVALAASSILPFRPKARATAVPSNSTLRYLTGTS